MDINLYDYIILFAYFIVLLSVGFIKGKGKRASSEEYFISKGIDGTRIKAVGYGDTRPVAPNDTDEGRAANRRIEATELKNVRVMLPQGW